MKSHDISILQIDVITLTYVIITLRETIERGATKIALI